MPKQAISLALMLLISVTLLIECSFSREDLRRLISHLNHASHETRQQAKESLRKSGQRALPELEHAATNSDDISIAAACLELIVEWLDSDNPELRLAARQSLTRLREAKSELVARAARTALSKVPEELLSWIEQTMNGVVVSDPALAGDPIVEVHLDRTRGIDPGFARDTIRNQDIERLQILDHLRSLTLEYRPRINDDVFEHLSKLPQLKQLNLSRTSVTGKGFKQLPTDSKIEKLNLSYCRLQDSCLQELARLPNLKSLVLNGRGNEGWSEEYWAQHIQSNSHGPVQTENLQRNGLRGGLTDAGVENLSKVTGLENVSVTLTNISDQSLGHLAKLPNLRSLNIDRTVVTDKGTQLLESASQLEELSLAFTFISDESIASLTKLKNLRRLNLYGTAISGQAMRQLKQLKKLEYLGLSRTRVRDEDLMELATLPNLVDLDLKHTQVSLAGLIEFAKSNHNISPGRLSQMGGFSNFDLQQSSSLSLKRQNLTDSVFELLSQFPNLKMLSLNGSSITDEQLVHLQRMPGLTSLDLCNTRVTDEGIAHLRSMDSLQRVSTFGTEVTFSAMHDLFCNRLGKTKRQLIDAGNYTDRHTTGDQDQLRVDLVHRGVTDDDVIALAEIEDLNSLKIAGNPVTDEGVRGIPVDSRLKVLWISGGGITVDSLQHLSQLRELRSLWVTDAAIDNQALMHLPSFKTLTVLNLCGCDIDDHAIDHLKKLASLQTLFVDHNAFSPAGFTRLASTLPDLEVIRSTQRLIRNIKKQETLYDITPFHSRFNGGRYLEHPLVREFGREFFCVVTSLNLPADFDCALLIDLDSLESVYFGEHQVNEDALEIVKMLPSMKRIGLYRSYVTTSGLRHLAGMKQLQSLDLQRSTANDEGLKQLQGLTGLKTLRLGGYSNELTPDFLHHLNGMPGLEDLSLSRTPATDDSIKQLIRFPLLRKLSLREARIAEGVEHLVRLSNLKELDLSSTYITDRELKKLAALKLNKLTISNTFVSSKGINEFKQACPETRLSADQILSRNMLQIVEPFRKQRRRVGRTRHGAVNSLDLRHVELDQEFSDLIDQMPDLAALTINGAASDLLIRKLVGIEGFQSLTISDGSIGKPQLKLLGEKPSFERLSLYRCQLTDEAITALGKMQRLTSLALNACHVNGQITGDQHIAELQDLKQLTWLNLNNSGITDESMKVIETLPKLRRLFVSDTKVTDNGVYPVSRWAQMSEIMAANTTVTPNHAEYGLRRVSTRSSR